MKKSLQMAAFAVAMTMTFGFGTAVSAEEIPTTQIPAPENAKTVQANGDGTYDITLSFKESVQTETNNNIADVVIVADHSGSMSGSYWTSLKNAVNVLTDEVLTENTGNQEAIVVYASTASIVMFGDSYWTSSADAVKETFENMSSPYGSTNAAQALKFTETVLASARPNSVQYVVFMSDGYPDSKSSALQELENLRTDYPDAIIYSVGVPGCSDSFMKSIAGTDENYFFADDADALTDVFGNIATIITKTYSNVVISDTLSPYAEYVNFNEEGEPVFDVSVIDDKGNAVVDVNYTLVYDADTNTVTLDLGTETIPDKWTYTLSYTVKPNEYAKTYYAENGYDAVGDENTDTEGNATSSGKEGFQISSGKIDFTYRNTASSAEFANPVFQVSVLEPKFDYRNAKNDVVTEAFVGDAVSVADMSVLNGIEVKEYIWKVTKDGADVYEGSVPFTGYTREVGVYVTTLQLVDTDDNLSAVYSLPLTVKVFEESSVPENSQGTDGFNTGDTASAGIFVIAALTAAAALVLVLKKRHN